MADQSSAVEAPCIRISNLVPNVGAQGVVPLALMVLLVIVVHLLSVPNPNMILVSRLVVCSSLFGFVGGITAGATMMCYSLYFFSVDNSWFTYRQSYDENFDALLRLADARMYEDKARYYERHGKR